MVHTILQIKNISEVTEPLKEQILKGDVHTIDEIEGMAEAYGLQRYDQRGVNQFHPAWVRDEQSFFWKYDENGYGGLIYFVHS